MTKFIILSVFLILILAKTTAQNNAISLSFAPQVSSIHQPKPYDGFNPALSHNFSLGYSLTSKKHVFNVFLLQHSNNARITYNVTSSDNPEGGIGNATSAFSTKGATLGLGYGFVVLSKKKIEIQPNLSYGIGYYYSSGLKNPLTNVNINSNIQMISANYDLTSFIEKFHHRLELATKLIFKPEKKVQFFLQPAYSIAMRNKDGKKQYAFTSVYWAVGMGIGVSFNF